MWSKLGNQLVLYSVFRVYLTFSYGNELISSINFQLTQSLQELTTTKEETNNRFERETMLVKELTEANYSLSQQANEYDSKISSLSSELEELKDTISQLRESVETKESELQVRFKNDK